MADMTNGSNAQAEAVTNGGKDQGVDVPSTDTTALESSPNREPQAAGSSGIEAPLLNPNAAVNLIRDATDRTLTFLSTASNETLVGCLVGLGAATYIILGRVGLVLGGVVGGVYLHASWERSGHAGQDDTTKETVERRKKEAGVEVVKRLLDWKDTKLSIQEVNQRGNKKEDFTELPPECSAALTTLTDAIVNGYVKWWYSPLVPTDPTFPGACRATLTKFFLAVSSRMSRQRPAETFLEFVMNSSSIIVVFLSELSAVFTLCPSVISAEDAVYIYLRTNPQSNLANLLDKEQQDRKLRLVSDDILRNFLDKQAYQCDAVRAFLQQILANLILETTIQKCSQAAFLNEWIIYLLEEAEPEILTVLDEGVEQSTVQHVRIEEPESSDLARPESSGEAHPVTTQRKRTISRAEEAMEEAMREAQKLTQLMAEEDARKARESQEMVRHSDEISSSSTTNIQTPTSSTGNEEAPQEEPAAQVERSELTQLPPQESVVTPPAQIRMASLHELSLTESPTAGRRKKQESMTLHKAQISIFDESDPNDRRIIRTQPEEEYLIQVEPRSSQFSGWMFPRSYEDFVTLHEIVRRIAVVSGLNFTETHAELPAWRGLTRGQLRVDLEKYLVDALDHRAIADSEGMKRFMDRDTAAAKSPALVKAGLFNAAALENVGKGFVGAMNNAHRNVAGGGKAVFSGVTGAFGKIGTPGLKRTPTSPASNLSTPGRRTEMAYPASQRPSMEERRNSLVFTEDGFVSGSQSTEDLTKESLDARRSGSSSFERKESDLSSLAQRLEQTRTSTPPPPLPKRPVLLDLPPPPSDVNDDYMPPAKPVRTISPPNDDMIAHMSFDGIGLVDIPSQPSTPAVEKRSLNLSPNPLSRVRREAEEQPTPSRVASPARQPARSESANLTTSQRPPSKPKRPLSEKEAQVVVELLFTVINELYTLSSAWTFRRTLLNAAKTFLLRPGNPQLESIRALVQDSVLDANTSDAGIATHIRKIRQNALPTEEELKNWPPPKTQEEKEAMRIKARRLLVEKGMPQALTSVMGLAASGEALGKVFDCLQVEEVARGLVFGLLLQAVRALTQ